MMYRFELQKRLLGAKVRTCLETLDALLRSMLEFQPQIAAQVQQDRQLNEKYQDLQTKHQKLEQD